MLSRTLPAVLLLAWAVPVGAQSGGVSTEWDARKMLDALTAQMQHFKSVIERVKPESWNGAPQTYLLQWKTAQTEMGYLLSSVDALAKQPERLPLALDAYFRMLTIESTFASVIEGVRKYQNPGIADLLQAAVNENSVNRDRLRQYLQDLAVQKEQEFRVADQEAQRCRSEMLRQSTGSAREKHK